MEILAHEQRVALYDEIMVYEPQHGPVALEPVPLAGPGVVWGVQRDDDGDAVGDEWWLGDGTLMAPAIIQPPDPDAWYIGDLGGTQGPSIWPAGGGDGFYVYHPVIGSTGQWYVDQFDSDMTELLDRWPIPGWNSMGYFSSAEPYYYQQSTFKHLAAGPGRVVVIADLIDPSAGELSIDVAVFDSETGDYIASWQIPVAAGFDNLEPSGGSCLNTDSTAVFFPVHRTSDGNAWIASVNLETGVFTMHVNTADVDFAITSVDPSWTGNMSNCFGVVEVDGDLIFTAEGVVRVQIDGVPVWWHNELLGGFDQYHGLAQSGRGSVWALRTELAEADEYTDDGIYVQTITLPEPAMHAWLNGFTPIPRKTITVINHQQGIRSRTRTGP